MILLKQNGFGLLNATMQYASVRFTRDCNLPYDRIGSIFLLLYSLAVAAHTSWFIFLPLSMILGIVG